MGDEVATEVIGELFGPGETGTDMWICVYGRFGNTLESGEVEKGSFTDGNFGLRPAETGGDFRRPVGCGGYKTAHRVVFWCWWRGEGC